MTGTASPTNSRDLDAKWRDKRSEHIKEIRRELEIQLKKDGYVPPFRVVKSGAAGQGIPEYGPKNSNDSVLDMALLYDARFGKGGRDSAPTYDLRNWWWIELKRKAPNGTEVSVLLVSFQAPDFDAESGNHHVLINRIALIDGGADGFDGSGNFEDTGLTLPLSREDVGTLAKYVERRLDLWEQRMKSARFSSEGGDTPREEA